jgi:hypothetical protein
MTFADKLKNPKIIAVIAIAIVIITLIVILIFIPSKCKEGTFGVNGKNPWFGKCTKCASGTSAEEGSSECMKCDTGTYSIEGGICEDQCSNLPKTKTIKWGKSNDPSFKSQNTGLDTIVVRGPSVEGDNRITDACLAQLHDMSGCANLAVKTLTEEGREDGGGWFYDGYLKAGCAPWANQESIAELDAWLADTTKNETGLTKDVFCVQREKTLESIANDMNAWRIMNDGHHPSGCCNKANKANWDATTSTVTYDSPCIN